MSTKRERLLDWIRSGDSVKIPVLFGPGKELTASFLNKQEKDVTWQESAKAAEETGTHNIACLHTMAEIPHWPFCFIEGLEIKEFRELLPDGTPSIVQKYTTPHGILTSSMVLSAEKGTCPGEYMLKGEKDIPALTWLLEQSSKCVKSKKTARELLYEKLAEAKLEAGGLFPTLIGMTPPAFSLMLAPYMDKETALLFVYDHPELMDRLIEYQWDIQSVWLEAAAKNDIDIYRIAINGLEWLSPALYKKYMIPQTRCIAEFAAAHGKLSWVHTCGKIKMLAERGVYSRMGVDVVESLSTPPTGDISDMKATRGHIGSIATRGGINNEYFYAGDTLAVVKQAEYVLDSVAGYRHMIGDTNPPSPPYPKERIEAVINAVRARGQLFE